MGSFLAKGRRREARRAVVRKLAAAPVPSDDEILAVISTLPGYDPFRDAEGYEFDVSLGRRAVAFFHEQLSHVKGDKGGEPFVLEPWEQAIVANLFGWVDADGVRRYRQAFVYVPRKNGKTAIAAGVIGYLLLEDGEPGAEIYGAACKYDQASLVWIHLANMIRRNKSLMDRVQIFKGQNKAIQLNEDEANVDAVGVYRPICYSSEGAQGLSPSGAVIDELHTFPDGELVDSLERGVSARRQPLLVMITTADYARDSICNRKLAYARSVLDGTRSDSRFLPVIYEASRDDDWTDEAVWRKANPNLGVSKSLEYMREAGVKAQSQPSELNNFLRYELNVVTDTAEQWLSLDAWDDCLEDKPIDLAGKPCWCGLDLSATTDTSAFVAVFPIGNLYYVRAIHWLPGDNLKERAHGDRTDYETFKRLGFLRTTPGTTVDYAKIGDDIWEFCKAHDVREIAYDPVYAAPVQTRLVRELGFKEDRWIEFRQVLVNLTVGAKAIERTLTNRTMRHNGNGLLRTQVSNATVYERNNCIMAVKAHERKRIDGVVALEMAMARSMMVGEKRSVYETRGVLVL